MPVWIRAVAFILLVPGAVGGWVPWYVAGSPPLSAGVGSALSWLGIPLVLAGWGVLLWCARDFARRGRGTPAPYDAPRALVVEGLYRYVRNPMYLGVVAAIVGQAIWFRSAAIARYAAGITVMFHLVVVLYEEPMLRRTFGSAYAEYRARVPRWLPRLWRLRAPRPST